MGLFDKSQIETINNIAKKSQNIEAPKSTKKASSINAELEEASKKVLEYFKDSPAILITSREQLHDYVTDAIEVGRIGIDTETTGLDRNSDTIVGSSLYFPGGVECYIPNHHRALIFESDYNGQLQYEEVAAELKRMLKAKTKMVFANANFDLYMIYKDFGIDLDPCYYYDVILAWRCLKENEKYNDLKSLYNKYVLKGKGDPKRFSDFFKPSLFPYSKPEIAKLYAANDAKITYELFEWQLPYTMPSQDKCKANKLENISNLIWNVEFPIVPILQDIERAGMYIDQDLGEALKKKYHTLYDKEMAELRNMVQDIINTYEAPAGKKVPFTSGDDFNPRSTVHVKYLLYDLMGLPKIEGKEGTGVDILTELNKPVTNKIVEVRSLATNISTFVDKLPNAVASDGKIHADFKQCGADTGRMSSANPNLQNIPAKLNDIRHMFRADPSTVSMRDMEESGATIFIEIAKYDSVKDGDGSYIKAHQIEEGTILTIFKDGEEVKLPVHHTVNKLGKVLVVLEVE